MSLERLEDRIVLSNFVVANTNYSGTGSLGAAIASAIVAGGNDTISFTLPPNSTIALTGADVSTTTTTYGPSAYIIAAQGLNLTIDGSATPGLTIDGGGVVRPFVVEGGAALTLANLTVSRGSALGGAGGSSGLGDGGGGGAGLGGAVYNDGGSFTADGVTFTNNVATGGAGGASQVGSNPAGGGGGGMGATAAGHSGGAGGTGGGAGGQGGTEDDVASGGNFGGGGGGGVYSSHDSSGGNGGFGGGGGGSYGQGGFAGGIGGTEGASPNSIAGGGGGGLGGGIFSNAGSITLINDTFTNNSAGGGAGAPNWGIGGAGLGYGGAVFLRDGSLSATFDTFSANHVTSGVSTPGLGSDVYVLGDGNTPTATFVDDILGQSGETVSTDIDSSAIYGGDTPTFEGSSNNLVSYNPDGTGLPDADVLTSSNPMLNAIASNGGPTDTMSLQVGSPAIGAGIAADYPSTQPITTDQRGLARADTPDIGAYEYTAAAPTVTALSPTDGPAAGGTTVTITGTNFNGATAVDFGTTAATDVTVVSDTSITAHSPAGGGTVDVSIITAGGTSVTSAADHFTYVGVPAVTITGGPLALGSTTPGTTGSAQSYTVSGTNLIGDLVITPPTGVQLSDDGGITWATSLSLTPDGGAVASTVIEARIGPSAPTGTISGAIANTSSGATEQDVTVTGTVAQATTTTTLAAATTAQGTTLTAAVVFTSPGGPPVVGTVAFYDGTTLLGIETVVNGVASLDVTSLPPGMHSFVAVFTGDGTTSTSQATLVVSTANPTVTSVARYGFHAQSTYLLLKFSTALDPASARNVSNYTLLGPIGHQGVPSDAVAIESAVYDPATHTVTLKLSHRWNIHWRWQLTVNGTSPGGVQGISGAMLDGASHGHSSSATTAGSNFVAMVSMKNLVGRASKLPTLALIDAMSEARPLAEPTAARIHATAHTAAVDHLLERGLLHISARHAKR